MKRTSHVLKLIVFSLMVVVLASCGKDGPEGPLGPRGERGDRGEQGSNGVNGKTVLNGTSDPTSTSGEIGDFYINTNSYLIFGPKTATGWGSGTSILGARGANGAKGDKGDKGDKGNTGDRGATGPKGDKGDKGEADYVILNGTNDPTNAIGKAGDFYYNTLSKTLFFRYIAIINTPAWGQIAKLSNTIQFSTKADLPVSNQIHINLDLPQSVMERSILNVYVKLNLSQSWYPLPGYVGNEENEFRIYFSQLPSNSNITRLTIDRVVGSSAFTNADVRIVVTEAEVFRTISKRVDFNNYMNVNRYFQLGK